MEYNGKKDLGCYYNTYLKTDVSLQAGVFETFQNTCLKQYKLNLAYVYTAPWLGLQALLNTASEYYEHEAKCKDYELCLEIFRFELLKDVDIPLLEKGIWGEII